MDDRPPFDLTTHPTSSRPLLGITVLVVEDSRFACEAIRLLCLRSGARIRRADCLVSARRHLQVYRPSAVIIDMGLPDGSGAELISELAQANPRVDVILGTSGDDSTETAARVAGADSFLPKPVTNLTAFQMMLLSFLPTQMRPTGPHPVVDIEISPDPVALRDDMIHAASILRQECQARELDYVARFLRGVARSARDTALLEAASDLAASCEAGTPPGSDARRVASLIQARLDNDVSL